MSLRDFLACPDCNSGLDYKSCIYKCNSCKREWGEVMGVPYFVGGEAKNSHFEHQNDYFSSEADARADEYTLAPWQEAYLRRFLENINLPPDALVIDCGSGSGYMAIELAKKGYQVIATDLTLKNLVKINQNIEKYGLEGRLLAVCALAESLPIKTGMADVFISNAVLEHIPDEATAIKEIDRVTKKNASLMLAVPLSYRFLNPILMPLNWLHDKRIGHLRRYNIETIKQKFKGSSYYVDSCYYKGHTSKVLKVIINMFIHIYDERKIEEVDAKMDGQKLFASNILCFMSRTQ